MMPPADGIASLVISGGPAIVLASASAVRTRLLSAAGVPHEIIPAHIEEAEGATGFWRKTHRMV